MDHNVTDNAPRDIKQDQLVTLLLAGKSISLAAKEIGVSRVTASRWLKIEEVQNALMQGKAVIEKSAYDIIIEKYRAALEPACDVVVEIAKSTMEPAAARLKAVQMIHDRLAPVLAAQPTQEPLQGAQGVLVAASTLPYLTDEELGQIEKFVALAEERRAQAEQDRETLERKRM